ncbi:MAG: hypothetical protein OXC80_07590 [Gammaproteobacteria bacterium]|nr:hypothetical protein [Gammaproteobacteria bacterium]
MDIPGYDIREELSSQNGCVTYLAETQENITVQLHVLELKGAEGLDREQLNQQERTYRGGPLQSVEPLLEVGFLEDHLFIATEWTAEQYTLEDQFADGIKVSSLCNVAGQVVSLLDSIYGQGLSYGTVSPDHIELRQGGRIRLKSVFKHSVTNLIGLAVSEDLTYQSPEQASAGLCSLNGDSYSVGMIIFECLVGRLPWYQTGPEMLRVSSQSLPAIPKRFQAWEPFLQKILAFDANSRYETVDELIKDIDAQRAADDDFVLTSKVVTDSEIDAVVHGLQEEQKERQDTIRRQEKRGLFVRLTTIIGPLVILALLIYLPQTTTIQIWFSEIGIGEHPNLQAARQNADALRADPNQSFQAIIAAYNDVLSYSPTDAEAISAKLLLKKDWEESIRLSLERNDVETAQVRVNEVIAVYPEDENTTTLFNRIQQRRQALTLLSDADTLFDEHGYDTVTSTTIINLYKEVARLYPENEQSPERLNGFASYFATLSTSAATGGDVSLAIEYLTKADMANPEHPTLRSARAALQAAETLQEEITQMLVLASQLRTSGNLIMPSTNNAANIYHQVLAIDPENSIAVDGMAQINVLVLKEFAELVARRDFTGADEMLSAAKAVGLFPDTLEELNSMYLTGQRQQAIATSMVDEARQHYGNGYITEPPENNAVAVLRQALKEDPNNAEAIALLQQCSAKLARVAQDAHAAGFRFDAAIYLELAISAYPNNLSLHELKDTWESLDAMEAE